MIEFRPHFQCITLKMRSPLRCLKNAWATCALCGIPVPYPDTLPCAAFAKHTPHPIASSGLNAPPPVPRKLFFDLPTLTLLCLKALT